MKANNKVIDRRLLIKAILDRDKESLILMIGDTDSQIHQFYTQDGNVFLGAGEQIEYNEAGDYYDYKGNRLSFQQLKAFEAKSRERTTKLQILPDLICLQICSTERLNEIILELKENAKSVN